MMGRQVRGDAADAAAVVDGPRPGTASRLGVPRLSAEQGALLASVTAVAGVFAVLSTAISLWSLWRNDPLKSIGGFVPAVSLALVLRVWKSLGWAMPGGDARGEMRDAGFEIREARGGRRDALGERTEAKLGSHNQQLQTKNGLADRTKNQEPTTNNHVPRWRERFKLGGAAWAGLALLAATIALVHVRDVALIEFVAGPGWAVFLPPHQFVALAYGVACVLIFGGVRLLRAAAFPVALLWLVNPVPNAFTLRVDLPLQQASSYAARGFAHALGQTLTPDQLRLMFTPEFGMFIAPGCDGIRGAITMGMIALVVGHLYRFRLRAWAGVVVCAVLLGYVFNLVRLCALVVYYIFALHAPVWRGWFQENAGMADYVIGACLFFVAGALLVEVVRRFGATDGKMLWPRLQQRSVQQRVPAAFAGRYGIFLAVLLAGSVSYVRALAAHRVAPPSAAVVDARFPQQVGAYRLVRQWDEGLLNGPVVFHWLEYADAAGERVSVGVSPVLGAHDTLICHAARGEDWLWHGGLSLPTPAGAANLSGSLFNDGTHEYLEAATVCSGESCGQFAGEQRGFVYSKPETGALLGQSAGRPIPVLLRAEVADAAMAPELARVQLTERLRGFLAETSVAAFTRAYREGREEGVGNRE